MELNRRFVFRGNAAAFGGRIVRPEDVVLEMPGASSLAVTGGRSVARIGRTKFKNFVSFDSASTLAEGLFDDLRGVVALSHHRVAEDSLTTSTRARAEIRKLVVGSKKRLKVERAAAELRARSPTASGEPPIVVADAVVEGVTIDGFALKMTLERGVFSRYDTHAKLLTASDEPQFARKHGRLFMSTGKTIYATVVRKIEWDGRPNPAAEIDRHSVVVKDFGRIFFGEILITSTSRRLTMIRIELGSDEGGSAGGPDVDINGIWYP